MAKAKTLRAIAQNAIEQFNVKLDNLLAKQRKEGISTLRERVAICERRDRILYRFILNTHTQTTEGK